VGQEMFRYDGKRAVVVGGASGMGRAAAELVRDLGAEVWVLDIKPAEFEGVRSLNCDLRDKASIDHALTQLAGPVDALFSCSGIWGNEGRGVDLMLVNFIGQRHLIEEAIRLGLLANGSAIAMISSEGGLRWAEHLPTVMDFLQTPDYESAQAWVEAHPDFNDYRFSKEAMTTYTKLRAHPLSLLGIRINATAPGPTMTPLMRSQPVWLAAEERFRDVMHRPGATPEQQAYPLVFLNSDAASFVSGAVIHVDHGYTAGGLLGVIPVKSAPSLIEEPVGTRPD
jgi:NAD(P)-dependent dehydrogenase (short-subunit alcohol dehydrogenase family)